jgi:hypothetical protein
MRGKDRGGLDATCQVLSRLLPQLVMTKPDGIVDRASGFANAAGDTHEAFNTYCGGNLQCPHECESGIWHSNEFSISARRPARPAPNPLCPSVSLSLSREGSPSNPFLAKPRPRPLIPVGPAWAEDMNQWPCPYRQTLSRPGSVSCLSFSSLLLPPLTPRACHVFRPFDHI